MATFVRLHAPHVFFGPLPALMRSLLALVLVATGTTAHAECLNQSSGDNQTVVKGSAISAPLTAGITTMSTSPPNETFNWSVAAPLTFTGNGNQTLSETLPWMMSGPNNIVDSVQGVYIPPSAPTGSATVSVSTTSFPTLPISFTINIGALLNPATTKLAGDNQALQPGSPSALLELGLTHTDPGGGPTVLSAVNVPVIFTISDAAIASFDPGGPLNTFKIYSDGGGIAALPFYVNPSATIGANFTITAAPPGYPSQTFNASVTAGVPTMTIVSGNGQSGESGTTSNQLIVETYRSGTPENVQVTFDIVEGDAVFLENGATSFTSMQSGNQQHVSVIYGDIGTIRVTANASGYPGVQFTLTSVANGAVVVMSGDGQVLAPGAQSDPIVLATQSTGGPLLPGHTLLLAVVEGDAVIAESGGTTFNSWDSDEDGLHTFSLIAGGTSGPIKVSATSSGLTEGAVNASVLSPVVLEPMQIIAGDGQSAPVGSVLPEALKVHVPVVPGTIGPAVTFAVTSGSARFVDNNLATITVPLDANSDASAQLQFATVVGDVGVLASAPGYQSVQFALSALAPGGSGSGVSLTAASTPSIGTTGFDSAPLIVLLSNGGSAVAGAAVTWQIVSGDATLLQSNTTTNVSGRAQTTVHFGENAGAVMVRAEHLVNLNSTPLGVDFNLSAGDPSMEIVSGDLQTGAVGTAFDHPIVFRLRYADGSGIGSQPLSFAIDGDATVLNPAVTTDTSGSASVQLRFGTSAGHVGIDAIALSGRAKVVASATSFVPTIDIVSGNNQSAMAGSALPQPLVIKLSAAAAAQSLAKGLGGLTVHWHTTCGNGSLEAASTTTDATGQSQNQLTLGTSPGCNSVEANIAAIGSVSFSATGTAASNSVLEILSGGNQRLVPQADSAPLRVRVRSAGGEPVAGLNIRFTADRAQAQLSDDEVTTAADGTAATTVRMGLPGTVKVIAAVADIATIPTVEFTVNVGIANTPGLTPPQERVAEVIDIACPALAALNNPTPRQLDLLQRCSELVVGVSSRPGEVRDALGNLLAHKGDAQNAAALAAADGQFNNLKARFSALRSGSRGFDLAGLNLMTSGGALPLSLLPSAIALGVGEEPPAEVGAAFSRWGFFATGTIGRGERDPDSLDPGFKYDSYDLTAGIDYRMNGSWILGGALGFNRNTSDLPGDAGGMDASGWTASGYASWFNGASWYADAVLSYGHNSYDLDRRIRYSVDSLGGGRTLIDQIASASPGGNSQSLSLSLGRDFSKNAWTFGPYLRAAYSKLDFDAYTETMSNPDGPGAGFALAVDGRTLKSLQGVVGGKLSYAISTNWGVLVPNAQFEWVNEFEDDPDFLVTRFVFDPMQTPILIDNDRIDSNYINLGVGLSGVFANGRSAYVYYERVTGQSRMSSDSLAVGVRIEF